MFVSYQFVRNSVIAAAVIGGSVWVATRPTVVETPDDKRGLETQPVVPLADGDSKPVSTPVSTQVAKPETPVAVTPSKEPTAAATLERARVVALIRAPASGKKAKDALGAGNPKVNLYDDDGDGRWDRAKLDVDRDGEPEEKWTVKAGIIERRIIADNRRLIIKDGRWVPKP